MTVRLSYQDAIRLGAKVFGEPVKESAPVRRKDETLRVKGRSVKVARGAFSLDVHARPEAKEVCIVLPMPPTTNHLYANSAHGGRHITDQYSAWLTTAGWALLEQKPGRIVGAYEMLIEIVRPSSRKADLGNREKAVSDLLVKQRVLQDDHLAESITTRWSQGFDGVRVTVRKWEGAEP